MSYSFLDAYSSVQSAASSIIGGGVQRPIVEIVGTATLYSQPSSLISGSTSSIVGTSSIQILPAPSGSQTNYVTQLLVSNGHPTLGTFVRIQDGSSGPTLVEGYAAAAGGGFTATFPAPLKQSLATGLFAANVTSSCLTVVAATGYTA